MPLQRQLLVFIALTALACSHWATAQDIEIVRGERYGVSQSHRLNLYIPADSMGSARPLLTILGGTDQAQLNSWDETAIWFASRGYSVVVAGYRPLAQLQWPQGPDEMRDIAGWVRASLGRLGAAQEGMMMDEVHGMFVLATGIAANHIAAYAYHEPSHMGRGASGMQAAVLANTAMLAENQQTLMSYFKQDQSLLALGQPLALAESYVEEAQVHLLLLDPAEMEPVQDAHNQLLKQKICDNQPVCPERVQYEGDAGALLSALKSADGQLMQQIHAFFEESAP